MRAHPVDLERERLLRAPRRVRNFILNMGTQRSMALMIGRLPLRIALTRVLGKLLQEV